MAHQLQVRLADAAAGKSVGPEPDGPVRDASCWLGLHLAQLELEAAEAVPYTPAAARSAEQSSAALGSAAQPLLMESQDGLAQPVGPVQRVRQTQ